MRASLRWLKELSGVDASVADARERLTRAGLEVEAVTARGAGLDHIVVAEVRRKAPHPKRDKLTLVTVFDGEHEVDVLCGAPNVPEPGGRVLFARVGARLPGGLEIGERAIAGVTSRGMICSEAELDIGADAAGIYVLGQDVVAKPGVPVARALDLEDWTLEIGLTPNRPDCLGHVGLARELAVLSGKTFAAPVAEAPARVADPASVPKTPIEIVHPDRCPRYGAGVVLDVRIAPSPFSVRYRLHNLGIRAINNVVDVTNIVLLEWGHPIHAFDLDKLRGERIVVRRARAAERMATLDGIERVLTDDDLLICDGQGPVAVAGVMGGANSEIADTTTRVLVECAYFDPRSVRRTARRLGLHTEASHRFERGVDPGAVPAVLAHTLSLLSRLAGGAASASTVDAYPAPVVQPSVVLRDARIGGLLGFEPSRQDATRVLEGIGCTVVSDDGTSRLVTIPSWRPDMSRDVDLVEEVGRVLGFERIPSIVPSVKPSTEGTLPIIGFARRLREQAAAIGLDEAVNYAFVSRRELELARVPTDCVELANPLSDERAVLRTSLLPGLAADVRRARRHQVARAKLFEVARTFHPVADAVLPSERQRIAIALAGLRRAWIGDAEPFDFFDVKGVVEALVRPLVGVLPETVLDAALAVDAPFLHPRRRARVRVAGLDVGALGELHPDVVDALELGGAVAYAELDIGALLAAADRVGPPIARSLPRFPSATRDIAVVVAEPLPAAEVASALREAAGELVEDVSLFDLYRGAPVPAGHKSLAFHVVYRDRDATLTDARVDEAHGRLVKAAEARFGASLRA